MDYGMTSAACEQNINAPSRLRQPTARDQLLQQKDALENQLKIVNDALEALDSNPELEKFLTLVGRAVRL